MGAHETKRVKVQPTCDTNAYAAGELIGALMQVDLSFWRDAGGLLVTDLHLVDLANQKKAIDLVFFNEEPNDSSGWTDNAALDIADADKDKIIKRVGIDTYASFNDNAEGLASQFRPFAVEIDARLDSPSLWIAFVAREAVTFAAAGDLTLNLGIVPT